MKIAIIGSKGYISSFLLERFRSMSDVTEILEIDQFHDGSIKYLNLLEPEKFDYDILQGIDYVIFTAAISGPDKCALEYEFCEKINVIGTSYLIDEALRRNCRVLFFSSDAVFGDIPGMIYNEYSNTEASTPYGVMKKAIEDKFKTNRNFKCIRLSYVVSKVDRFVSYCLACLNENKVAEVFHPFYRNCITIDDVIEVVVWMITNWESFESFVLNVAGKELVSRVRIIDEVNRYSGGKLAYSIVTPSEAFYKNRPAITQMESKFIEKLSIISNESFSEKIRKVLMT
jgi:dTDP-4-dehydrorhamnose reductase